MNQDIFKLSIISWSVELPDVDREWTKKICLACRRSERVQVKTCILTGVMVLLINSTSKITSSMMVLQIHLTSTFFLQ